MRVEEEISGLRLALEPLVRACGFESGGLNDEEFVVHLRRLLVSRERGRAGFECALTSMTTGDYLATLVWVTNGEQHQLKTSVGFSARGCTETVAFLRVAIKALKHPEYRDLGRRSAMHER